MPAITAMVVQPDGEHYLISIPRGQFPTAFKEHCGARLFDCVAVNPEIDAWVDDEGLLNDSEINPFVTALRNAFWHSPSPLAGTALITGGADRRGDNKSLSDENAASLTRLFSHLKGEVQR